MTFTKTLAIPALIFLLTSCTKKDDEVTAGPEVSVQEISKAILAASNGKTLLNSKVGDWGLTVTTQKIFNEPAAVTDISGKEIMAMADNNDRYDIEILQTIFDPEKNPPVVTKQTVEKCQVLKEDGTIHNCAYAPMVAKSTTQSMALSGPDLQQFNYARVNSNNEIQPNSDEHTFHNLSVGHTVVPPPDDVRKKENCGGVPSCQLHITVIGFDEITVLDGERTTYRHEMDFSSDVPFIAAMTRHCVKWNYKVENRYFPVEVCGKLANLEYGK